MTDSRELVRAAYKGLDDKKAEDISIIDIRGISVLADYFVIASGSNENQLEAMQDSVCEELHKIGCTPKQIEGNKKSTWVLIDFEDIIVHIFSREDRLFYELDKIWRDGKVVELDEL